MSSIQKTLEERIEHIENQLTIYQVISAYGPAADSCNMKDIHQLWHENCTYDIGGLGEFHGHKGIKEAFDGEFHQTAISGGSGHTSCLPHVVIDGDQATATHYGMLFAHHEGDFKCIRLIASTWDLVRTPGLGLGWQIMRRTNRLLNGSTEARELLSKAMIGPQSMPR